MDHFYTMLADRYYTGVITYEGEQFPGRHEPLITEELFERVLRVLALHGGGGTRNRQHHHYLKGLLWCGRCRQRIIITAGAILLLVLHRPTDVLPANDAIPHTQVSPANNRPIRGR